MAVVGRAYAALQQPQSFALGNTMRLVNLLIVVILANLALASNASSRSHIFGSIECSSYNENKDKPTMQFGYKNWWAGYMTGIGVTFKDGKSPEFMPETTNFIISIGSFCQSNPENTLKDAVDSYLDKQIEAGYAKVP